MSTVIYIGFALVVGFAGGVGTMLILLSIVADAWGKAMSSVEKIQERAE